MSKYLVWCEVCRAPLSKYGGLDVTKDVPEAWETPQHTYRCPKHLGRCET